ncbi:hypothetical protein [Agromyces aureus]|uniref:Transmembrane protein n=1 Tax=Agromyces aureus TaxID=453304 RepID=A0A191WDH4_9MICO|nr:hypothetical protein [Agromyces aureus]ANJ26229.1 hypothetical protein ATC03_05320 [Agromyces aureus]
MRRILDFRIVRWEFKVLYIAVAWIVGYVIVNTLASIGVPVVVAQYVNLLGGVVAFALAVRIFRGRDEPVAAPRAWWRMTAWPTLSRRLGTLFAGLAALSLLGLVLVLAGVEGISAGIGDWISVVLTYVVLAFLYLNSAVRMKRLGITKPAQLPKSIRLK